MHVIVPPSLASDTAGSGRRFALKRPTSSPARWLACVALPPLPKQMTLPPCSSDPMIARPAAVAADASALPVSATTFSWARKYSVNAAVPSEEPEAFSVLLIGGEIYSAVSCHAPRRRAALQPVRGLVAPHAIPARPCPHPPRFHRATMAALESPDAPPEK